MTVLSLRADTRHAIAGNKAAPTPAGSPTPSDMVDALNHGTTAQWLDVGPVAGNCLEFFSVDTSGIPGGSVINSVRVSPSWRRVDSAGGGAVINSAALDDAGNLVRGPDDSRIWGDLGSDYLDWARPTRYATADGRPWTDFSTLGFTVEVVLGSVDPPGEYRIYDVELVIDYTPGSGGGGGTDAAGIIDATGPSGVQTAALVAAWTWTTTTGGGQTGYQVLVLPGPLGDPEADTPVYDSGRVDDTDSRSAAISAPLVTGDYTAAVRGYATVSDQDLSTEWDTVEFSVSASLIPPDDPATVAAVFDPATVVSTVTVTEAASPTEPATRCFVERADGASEWIELGEATEDTPGIWSLTDPGFPANSLHVYRSRFTDGTGLAASGWVQSTAVYSTLTEAALVDRLTGDVLDVTLVDFEVTRSRGIRTMQPVPGTGPGAVTVDPGRGADRISLRYRPLDRATREALADWFASGGPWMFYSPFGEQWLLRLAGPLDVAHFRAAPTDSQDTGLRDSHTIDITLVQAVR